ncbi:Gfo/Idh/MocA family protein [Granulicoccus sp. GXG6511]|uniref:Gfo/Idh/MocA family protein n=1 Tax=Granulicoccus sp. GXG6511 TaxID=3381351 RepID=UPI003D7C8CF2
MTSIRWGIAGLGAMASLLAQDLALVPNAELVAVASRSLPKAEEFAARHGVPRPLGSYRALLEDPAIDAIHIATPHSLHCDLALAAIEHGKAVLVEKAFTATHTGAVTLVEAARRNRVFAMEGMWTRFQPAIVELRKRIRAGAIGTPLTIQADLMARRQFAETDRLFARELAGGALLDLGCYPVSLAQHFLGDVSAIDCQARHYANGADSAATINLRHGNGGLSALSIGFDAHGPGRFAIYGTAGWVEILPRFHHPTTVLLHRPDAEPETISRPPLGLGYSHELIEVSERVLAGDTESATMPLDDTLEVMRVLDECARQIGVHHTEQTAPLD